jgi:hypothetical protein
MPSVIFECPGVWKECPEWNCFSLIHKCKSCMLLHTIRIAIWDEILVCRYFPVPSFPKFSITVAVPQQTHFNFIWLQRTHWNIIFPNTLIFKVLCVTLAIADTKRWSPRVSPLTKIDCSYEVFYDLSHHKSNFCYSWPSWNFIFLTIIELYRIDDKRVDIRARKKFKHILNRASMYNVQYRTQVNCRLICKSCIFVLLCLPA